MLSPQSQPLRDYTNIKFKILIVVFSILGALSADIFLLRLGLEFLLIAPSDHKQFGSQSRARHAFSERVLMLWFLLPRKTERSNVSWRESTAPPEGCVVLTIYHNLSLFFCPKDPFG